MNKEEYYMNIALEEAKKAFKKNEVPVGAVIVLNDIIIAKGYNKKQKHGNVTNHAEIIAIKKASKKIKDWRLENCIMYVTLFPCPMCASAIIQSRIKKLVVGADVENIKTKEIGNLIFADSIQNNNFFLKEKVLHNECSNLLKLFFKNQRNKN